MIRLCLFFIVICGLIVFTVTPSTQTLSATLYSGNRSTQCVGCGFKSDCRSCIGGGTATYCTTFNCGACEEDGACGGLEFSKVSDITNRNEKRNREESQRAESQFEVAFSQIPRLQDMDFRIDVKTIRNIAILHPRFAATLVPMRYNSHPRSYVVHWTPVEMVPADIDEFISDGKNDNYFRKFDERARALNRLIQAGKLEEIVYYVTIENTDSNSQRIRIQVAKDRLNPSVDPAFSALEITTTYKNNEGGRRTKKVTWQVTDRL